ncbi:antitoxin YefM [Silvimonas terrae]|uniref:Antitoxin n=1 Tax=Silvimonas terrae TaxID=300266 RepID=A0A840RIR3_9NEIS|nr:type II toxin-antitoxin system prevent-host-death family antitoxin [Silvimonas terrae]MBB5192122.1 antitoxin YefM [Silvimonas terrae]
MYDVLYGECAMDALTYTYTRQNLAEVMRKVNDDRSPVVVTTQRGKPVVIMSLDDYQALEETAYLLRSPTNAKRLMNSVERLRAGQGQVRELIDDADQV